ncbi:signal peptidase II [Brachybacterium alimentarium]|nr:signal peptidase II [Brachybacterium alimentarium]RCS76289.1 signal peptidase II [Brachybacterium alimentarium]RCS80815.1 signal peptidase II [Brachybacterium alimentarium]RCS85953.1 signal peptidase II [Brachybacterium alimentarium]
MLLVGGALAVADQLTKNWAEANLHELVPQPFLGEFLQLTLLYNSGAAWGMGSGITPVVTCLQVAIVIGVIVFAVRAVRSPWYTLALGLVLGGALGNIHDRLLRPPGPFHGEVVDFLELPHWPVFNVADMAVVGGALLIVLLGVIGHAADPAEVDAEAEAEAEARAQGESPTDSVASPDDPESPKGTR